MRDVQSQKYLRAVKLLRLSETKWISNGDIRKCINQLCVEEYRQYSWFHFYVFLKIARIVIFTDGRAVIKWSCVAITST